MTLTEFLLARIAEDEAVAERLRRPNSGDPWGWQPKAHPMTTCGQGATQIHVNPARVLAVCEANRRIVAEHAPVDYTSLVMKSPNACEKCGVDLGTGDWDWVKDSFPCPTLRALALPYADHPDYDEAWRP